MLSASETHMDDRTSLGPFPEDLEEAIETVHQCPCCGAPNIMVPQLECKRCGEVIEAKAFIYERRGVFYGECVTLNLVSRGASQEEAIRRLQVAMFSYVYAVLSGGESSRGLIPRPSPLASWVRYYLHILMARISHLFGVKYRLATTVQQISLSGETGIAHC